MITIGDRVREAIDYMDQGRIEHALTPACIAIDVTAQKVAGVQKSSKSDYKKFVSEYMWLITFMGLPGLVAGSIRVPFAHPDIKLDDSGSCSLEDVVYHVIRCGLMHSTGLDSKISWSDDTILGIDPSGNLVLSRKLIWGLLGAVIFCPENKDERIGDCYWISLDGFKWFIQDVWGRLDLAQRILSLSMGATR